MTAADANADLARRTRVRRTVAVLFAAAACVYALFFVLAMRP